eukprot:2476999-Pyramimonas_sp.AAC.1
MSITVVSINGGDEAISRSATSSCPTSLSSTSCANALTQGARGSLSSAPLSPRPPREESLESIGIPKAASTVNRRF